MARKNQIVEEYARMWPREVFDCASNLGRRSWKARLIGILLVRGLSFLASPCAVASLGGTFHHTGIPILVAINLGLSRLQR